MNIGISVYATPGAHIWSSGLNQNLAFLVMLLRNCPEVDEIYLLNGGDGDELPESMSAALAGIPLVRPQDVTHRLDMVIEMGAQLPLDWMQHVRALGVRLVLFLVGHSYAAAAENPMFGGKGGLTLTGIPWHEIWMLPQHIATSGPMMRTLTRLPVFEVPHIWSPIYLDQCVATLRERGFHFGFDPAGRPAPHPGWRAAIFEPNISVVKNCVIPMLVCEQAYRLQADSLGLMMVMNSFHMKEHPTFNRFATHLKLTRDGKASYEPRLAFAECMAEHSMDVVVAHQWECGLNYAYYDALYGGYPLVHNSDFLRGAGVGLFYPGFKAVEGGRVLAEAWRYEPEFWQDYRQTASNYLRGLAPDNPALTESFRLRLQASCAVTP